jgi:hypothetical protein
MLMHTKKPVVENILPAGKRNIRRFSLLVKVQLLDLFAARTNK